jgi:hypothetical protein
MIVWAQLPVEDTGLTDLYFTIWSAALLPGRTDTEVYEAISETYGDYAIAATEATDGLYYASVPSGLEADFRLARLQQQAGDDPAESDAVKAVCLQKTMEVDLANGGRLDLILDEAAADAEAARAQIALVDARLPAAPAATGDAMTLTAGERTTLVAAVWNALTSGMVAVGSIGKWLLDRVGNATAFTGVFPGSVVANAPTGVQVTLTRTTLAAAPELSIEVDQNYSWSKAIPCETTQTGKTHKFSVYAVDGLSVPLWSLDSTHCAVGGTEEKTVTVSDDDEHVSTAGAFYWELVDLSGDTLLCAGNFIVTPRGDTK